MDEDEEEGMENDANVDLDDLEEPPTPKCGMVGYLFLCLLATGAASLLTIVLWSKVGFGESTLSWLQRNHRYRWGCAAAAGAIISLLYILDFFWPPHLPGQLLVLWNEDRTVGRSLLGIAGVLLLGCALLVAKEYPQVPMLGTIFLCPISVSIIRLLSKPKLQHSRKTKKAESVIQHGNTQQKLTMLKSITGQEVDVSSFFKAAMTAFMITFALILAFWLYWITTPGNGIGSLDEVSYSSSDLLRLRISAAYGLPYQTTSGLGAGPDSYAVGQWAGKESRTQVVEENRDPNWEAAGGDEFDLGAGDSSGLLVLEVRDANATVLGSFQLELKGLLQESWHSYREALSGGQGAELEFSVLLEPGDNERELRYLVWSTPMVVAISNFVFGLFALFRISVERIYRSTDMNRNELMLIGRSKRMKKDMEEHFRRHALRRSSIMSSRSHTCSGSFEADEELTERKRKEFMEMHDRHIKQLANMVKGMGCLFIMMIGLLYVASQLMYSDHNFAGLVLGLLWVFFVAFVMFIYLSFKRIVAAMGKWLIDMPAWRAAKKLIFSDWSRALLTCIILPAVPFVLLLSAANQSMRRCRRLYEDDEATEAAGAPKRPGAESPQVSPRTAAQKKDGRTARQVRRSATMHSDASGNRHEWRRSFTSFTQAPLGFSDAAFSEPELMFLTPRVTSAVLRIQSWKLQVLARCYLLCFLFFCYTVCPVLLNVSLSWMGTVLETWPFQWLVIMTFCVGVVAFLLPPVPGMTVYLFGGLMISNPSACPWGFWPGAFINIGVCWCLKLFACAVQQKCIGETLGHSLWVRQQVGVHTVAIRCIEAVLRKPGWSLGKVAILCGGPDWPTSVLAGILRLSLLQCELGTMPIILFVMPCALTGSFYLKRGTSPVWTRSANLMMILAVMVNMVLWAVAVYAIQRQLELDPHKLTRPLPQNVDLEWLDYRSVQISEACAVSWPTVPGPVRYTYALGAATQILVCHMMFWAYSQLFGKFQVSDPISDLSWYGEAGSIFTWKAIMILIVFFLAYLGPVVYKVWVMRSTRDKRESTGKRLDAEEQSWKERRLQEARDWVAPSGKDDDEGLRFDARDLGIEEAIGSIRALVMCPL